MTTDDGQAVVHIYGNRDASTCVVEFGDFECPYCAGAAPVLRQLVDRSDARIRLVYRHFPLFQPHPHALVAALAAESVAASAGPDAFWLMHDKLFTHQSRLTDPDLRLYAELVGGDPELAVGEAAQQFAPIVQADYAAALEVGVSATPTLFIEGVAYEGRIDLASLQHAAGSPGSAGQPGSTGPSASEKVRRRPWQRR